MNDPIALGFEVLTALMATIVFVGLGTLLDRRGAGVARMIFALWLAAVAALGLVILPRAHGAPAPLLLAGPGLLFTVFLTRNSAIPDIARRIPAAILVGVETFRVFVEIGLHGLAVRGDLPRMLTWNGANFDILIGATAPIVAWAYSSGRIDGRAVRLWSWIGIVMLANVMLRAALTAPGRLHLIDAEVPNRALGAFPFVYLPGFLAPLALVLHVLLLRSVCSEDRAAREAPSENLPYEPSGWERKCLEQLDDAAIWERLGRPVPDAGEPLPRPVVSLIFRFNFVLFLFPFALLAAVIAWAVGVGANEIKDPSNWVPGVVLIVGGAYAVAQYSAFKYRASWNRRAKTWIQ